MKIILTKDIPKVGRKGDVKDLAEGYAMNFVVPRGLGMKATPDALKKLEAEKAALDAERKVQDDLLAKSIETLGSLTITITGKANEKGSLFEGIGATRLAEEIKKSAHIELDPAFIDLDKPLKQIGETFVNIAAHGKKGKVRVVIEAEK